MDDSRIRNQKSRFFS